jgi:hypothetical protein
MTETMNMGGRNTQAVVCYRQCMAVTYIIIEGYEAHTNVEGIDKPDQGFQKFRSVNSTT